LFNSSISKNIFYLGTEKSLQFLNQIFLIVIIAPYLGADNYGLLSYSISLIGILLVFSNWGFERLVVIEIANSNTRKHSSNIVLNSFFIRIILSIAVLILFFITFYLFPDVRDRTSKILLILLLNLIFNSWIVFDANNQAKNNILNSVKLKSISIIIIISYRFILYVNHIEFEQFVISYLVEQFLLLILFSTNFFRQNNKFLEFKIDFKLIKRILKNGFYVALSGLCILVYSRLNQIIVNYYFDASFLGSFSLIMNIVEIPFSFASVLTILVLPFLSTLKNQEELIKLERSIFFIYFLLGIFISILFVIFSFAINKYFSNDFPDFQDHFIIAITMIPFGFISYFVTLKMSADHKFKIYLIMTLINTTLSATFSILLITAFGKYGATWGYVSGQIISAIITPFFFLKSYHKTLLAGVEMLLTPRSAIAFFVMAYENNSVNVKSSDI
jgi:O-antigen/teichoic acid export membrane protein